MIDIDGLLMLFVFVLFLAMLYLLNRTLFGPLLQFMDDRERSVTKDLEMLKDLGGKADELSARSEKILNEAKTSASAVRQKAIEEAKRAAETKMEMKLASLQENYDSFLEELEEQKQQLKNKLLSQVPLFKESIKANMSRVTGAK